MLDALGVNPVSILSDACRGLMLGEPWYTGPVGRPVVQSLLWALAIGMAVVFVTMGFEPDDMPGFRWITVGVVYAFCAAVFVGGDPG